MSDLILRNAAEPALRSRIGRNARNWSLQMPNEDDNIATFAKLFDEVIAAQRS